MKNYTKGVITGILIGTVIASVPVIAENIDVLFNSVRININGIDKVQWDENIELDNGLAAPSSVLYNGTTYLPIRKISELTGKKVYWNGDSKTVSITGQQEYVKEIVKKADSNGNAWRYYTFRTEELKSSGYSGGTKFNYYLGVSDEARGYERVYRISGPSVSVVDDKIYFVKVRYDQYENPIYSLATLNFDNNANTQDGEEEPLGSNIYSLAFDGEWLFIGGNTPGNGSYAAIRAYNCVTEKWVSYIDDNHRTYASNLTVTSEGDTSVIKFDYCTTGPVLKRKITFDKTTAEFGDMKIDEDINSEG